MLATDALEQRIAEILRRTLTIKLQWISLYHTPPPPSQPSPGVQSAPATGAQEPGGDGWSSGAGKN